MAEIAARHPDVIVTYGTRPAVAARGATHTIPIVVAAMADPVATGLAESLARPGRNLTGLSMGYADPVPGKWLEILREVLPHLSTVVLIMNPENPAERDLTNKLSKLAAAQRLILEPMDGRSPDAVDRAFTHAVKRAQAVIVTADPVIGGFHQARIISLAQKHRIPTIYAMRNFVDDGGLMAYGPDVPAMFRRAAEYVDKILKGANAGELPIEQPTRYSFVLNMKAAEAIGLAIPPTLELRADEILR
jgi:putative ABC transport system substrate-binding protein